MDVMLMNRVIMLRFCLFLLIITVTNSAFAAIKLNAMEVSSLTDKKTQIKLIFDNKAPKIYSYSIENPTRISIDLLNTISNLAKYNQINLGNTKSVTSVQAGNKTRMVINLKRSTVYSTYRKGSELFIILSNEGYIDSPIKPIETDSVKGSEASLKVRDIVMKKDTGPLTVEDIDFERSANGVGNVLIQLSSDSVVVDVNEIAGDIIVHLDKTQIPQELLNRLDVTDFSTPVKFIDISQNDEKGMIKIEASGYFNYLTYQSGNLLTISVNPTKAKTIEEEAEPNYKGEKISLNFQDIPIRSVLQIIADFTDLNLIASDTVTGNITLRLRNVPWDQALDLILKAKGLDKREKGSVLLVAPALEIAARERQELENKNQISQLAPLYTEVFRINYHDAQSVFKLFKKKKNSPNIFSERGEVIVDARSNSIILKESQAKLDEFRRLLKIIDVPVKQVLIEARIVNADDGFSRELGVKWTGAKVDNEGSRREIIGGRNSTIGVDISQTPDQITMGVGPNNLLGGNVLADLSAQSANASGIGIGILTNSTILNLELTAAAASSKIEIISQPKVITSDKTTAKIKSGEEIPYEEATSSGATSTSFKEAALSLEVTPQITPEGRVIMKLIVNNDARGESTSAGPAINTQEVNTQVLVNDGDTLVIGGVFDRRTETTIDKVPFFGDLPIIGYFFRRELKSDKKRELLMFITPKILDEKFALQ